MLSLSQDSELSDLLGRLDSCFPKTEKPWHLHEPRFGEREKELVLDCVESGWVSSVGQYVDQFEEMICKATGSKFAIAVVNGTAALHLSLVASGVNAGDEVIVPALSFVATANAVHMLGAVPHFVDGEINSMGMDVEKLRNYLKDEKYFKATNDGLTNKKTGALVRAIIPMHSFGQPCCMKALLELAEELHLVVVEDAAEALGSYEDAEHMGTLGLFGCLSFNGNKILTTGGGGAILTQDAGLATKVRHLSTTAKKSHPWLFDHDARGYNYRMPNLNAALGCAQLEQLDERLVMKRQISSLYRERLEGWVPGSMFKERSGVVSNSWLNALLLSRDWGGRRDIVLAALHDRGIFARPAWNLLHSLSPYNDCPRMPDLAGAEDIFQRVICLPSGTGLVDKS